ncbi:MAG: histidine kinase [Selenomonadaceae bacterium]|nr:histidine kinase [Selenomonadaceae bacterium]
MKITKREWKENLVYLVLWLILFIAPVITVYVRSLSMDHPTIEWQELKGVWSLYVVYIIAFVIHNFILAPMLIYRRRKILYFSTVSLLFVAFVVYQCQSPPKRLGERHREPPRIGMVDDRPPFEVPQPSINHVPPKDRPPMHIGLENVFAIIVFMLMLGMNLGIKLYFKMEEDEKEMQQIEKRSLQQQLAYLKYQINPHFFMNTLNNIHALVDIDAEKAKESIEEFSKLMRIVLYEDNAPTIKLGKEIEYLEHFVSLMRLRYPESVEISLQVPENAAGAEVPPLLMASIVENAFKHGVSYEEPSFIRISISVSGGRVVFCCSNSNHPSRDANRHGLGTENVKRRLELMYGNNYDFSVSDGPESYDVLLNIPSEL